MTAISVSNQTFTPGAVQPEPDIIVLHTTEGMGWPSYGGGSMAPHDTIRAIPGKGIEVRRHMPYDRNAKALVNAAGGVQTNKRGVIQFELVGTCDPKYRGNKSWFFWPEADDVVLRALADYLRPIAAKYGIPAAAPKFLPYPSSYGNKQRQRFTSAQWNAFNGFCGHQHVPENDHGDPGNFPIAKLLAFIFNTTTPPTSEEDDMSTEATALLKKIDQNLTALVAAFKSHDAEEDGRYVVDTNRYAHLAGKVGAPVDVDEDSLAEALGDRLAGKIAGVDAEVVKAALKDVLKEGVA